MRWWVLVLGAAAALSSVALMYLLVNLYAAGVSVYFGGDLDGARLREDFLDPFANFIARGGGLPALYTVLTAGAAGVLTRATGAANTVQGVLFGLASAVGIQLVGRAFGPFAAWELVVYPLLGLAGGWLGVALSRAAVERQEALYRATGALYAVDTPRVAAVGENLAGPDGERVTLWRVSPGVEDDGGSPSSPSAPGRRRGRGPGPGAAGWTRGGFRILRACGASRTRWFVRRTFLPPSAARGGRGAAIGAARAPELPGETDGLLVVSSRGRHRFFDRRKVRAYLTVGAQAALTLENLRLIEEARRAGMIGERKRLAREIHDTLIQGFANIVVNLEAAEGSLGEFPDPNARHLDEARTTAREGLSEARRIVWALRPGALEGAPPCRTPSRGSRGGGPRRRASGPTWPPRGRACRSLPRPR